MITLLINVKYANKNAVFTQKWCLFAKKWNKETAVYDISCQANITKSQIIAHCHTMLL